MGAPCLDTNQSIAGIHIWLKKPEIEFQSCQLPDMVAPTPSENFCRICSIAMASLAAGSNADDLKNFSCNPGSCADHGCEMAPTICTTMTPADQSPAPSERPSFVA